MLDIDFSPTAFPEAPVRADDLYYIVNRLRQGRCCALVGASNMGKSILLQSLLNEEVRRHCIQAGARPPVMVFVDCLAAELKEQAFHELLLRCIIEELETIEGAKNVLGTIKALHHRLLRSSDLGARSLFASSLRELCRNSDIRLVLILDEFDDVFRTLPPWPFRQLRALYSALGDRLRYVVATIHRMDRIRSDSDTYEYRELFRPYTHVLQPLSEGDALRLVAYLVESGRAVLDEELISLAVELSGGHPALLSHLCRILGTMQFDRTSQQQAIALALSRDRTTYELCQRLWDGLEEEEQEGLQALVGGSERALDANWRQALEAKGLVVAGQSGRLVVFSPIFGVFVRDELRRRCQVARSGVRCDFKTGQMWVDDREVTLELSELQRKLVRLLYLNAGAVCTHNEIAEEVWGVGEGVSPGAIYELVKRVRRKLEPNWRNPSYVVTVRGLGYRLQMPE